MANPYSIIKKHNSYIQPFAFDQIEKTLAVKDQRYNQNQAQVSNLINEIGSTDLLRQSDMEHLHDNLKDVLETLSNSDKIDFSRADAGFQLQGKIASAVDDRVLKHAGISNQIRDFGASVERIKKDNPDEYAAQNEWFARKQAGLDEYLADNGESDNLKSPLNYTPYIDVQKELDKNIQKWAKEFGFETKYDPNSSSYNGIVFTKESEVLSRDKVESFISQRLGAKEQNQIYMDAAYNLQSVSNDDILKSYKDYSNQKANNLLADKAIAIQNLKARGASNSQIKETRLQYDQAAATYRQNATNGTSRESMLRTLSKARFVQDSATPYVVNRVVKNSPDSVDVSIANTLLRRAELSLKKSKLTKTSDGNSIQKVLKSTPTEGKGSVDDSTNILKPIENYKNTKDSLINMLGQLNDQDVFNPSAYNDAINEKKETILQNAIDILDRRVIGDGVSLTPEQNNILIRHKSSLKMLNQVQNKSDSLSDRFTNSLVESLKIEHGNEDSNLSSAAWKNFPNTKRILDSGTEPTAEQVDIMNYEAASQLSKIQDSPYVENYIQKLGDKIQNYEDYRVKLETPDEKSKKRGLLDAISGVGKTIAAGFNRTITFDDEKRKIQRQRREDLRNETKGDLGIFANSLESIGTFIPEAIFQGFIPDQDITEFDPEDLPSFNKLFNPDASENTIPKDVDDLYRDSVKVNNQDLINEIKSNIEKAPKTFAAVIDGNLNPDIHKKITGTLFESGEIVRIDLKKDLYTLSPDLNDSGNVIVKFNTPILDGKGRPTSKKKSVSKSIPMNTLPPEIQESFSTEASPWHYNAENPLAQEIKFRRSFNALKYEGQSNVEQASLDIDQSMKSIDDVIKTYGIPPGLNNSNVDENVLRKNYFPSASEIRKNLVQQGGDNAEVNEYLSQNYEVDYVRDPINNVYNAVVSAVVGDGEKFQILKRSTGQKNITEQFAAWNHQKYILQAIQSKVID